MIKRLLLAASVLALAPVAPAHAQSQDRNWDATYAETERGFRTGNPDAQIKLIVFMSYSCPHCAQFEMESDAPMRLLYVQPGMLSLEVRNVLRNPLDLAAALTAECGPESRYFGNMRAIMRAQEEWLDVAVNAGQATTNRWMSGPLPARMRAIADDLDFYELMEPRGYSVAEIDRCLSDQAAIEALVARQEADDAEFEIAGTPSFAINGNMLAGVHNWAALQPALSAAAASTGE